MTMMARPGSTSMIPDMLNLLESGWPFPGRHPVHIEEFVDGKTYVIRAELPGLDPTKDIEVEASEGTLTISAERKETKRDRGRSEFRYGSFVRSVALPAGADTNAIEANYDKGILEIRVPMRAAAEERKVQINVAGKKRS
jgi:HSP20 family protein